MKKIGLIGCGLVASYGHMPAIAQVEDLTVHALLDPDPAALAAMQTGYGVAHAFTDAQAFFASGIDAVVVTSPAPAHLGNVLDAARHGKPVLCEKPLAMNPAEGQRMIRAMAEQDLPLYVSFCYRFSGAALRIKQLVDDGAIGKVKALRLIYNWGVHGKYCQDPKGKWILNPHRHGRMLEGGPLVDCGTHQIDLAHWWLDSPVTRFQAHGAWVDGYTAPDHVWLHMDHACGAHSVIEVSYSFGHTTREPKSMFTYELIGQDGVITYDRNHSFFELRTHQFTERLPYTEEKDFVGVYRAFSHALETGAHGHLCPADHALSVTRIAREATDQVIAARRPALALAQ